MYKLGITKSAGKFIRKLDAKQFRQVVSKILELREDVEPHDSRQLIGSPDYRRVDMGEYRIIYSVKKDIVKIAVVGKRNDDDVYRRFGRKDK